MRLTREDLDKLIDLLENDPSDELFAALHRKAVRYTLDPHAKDVTAFYLKIAFFDAKQLEEKWQPHFQILREAVSYARSVDIGKLRKGVQEEARRIQGDPLLCRLLNFLNQFGPVTLEEFRFKIVGMKGIRHTVRKAVGGELVKVFHPQKVDPYISLTFKGRRLVNLLDED